MTAPTHLARDPLSSSAMAAVAQAKPVSPEKKNQDPEVSKPDKHSQIKLKFKKNKNICSCVLTYMTYCCLELCCTSSAIVTFVIAINQRQLWNCQLHPFYSARLSKSAAINTLLISLSLPFLFPCFFSSSLISGTVVACEMVARSRVWKLNDIGCANLR